MQGVEDEIPTHVVGEAPAYEAVRAEIVYQGHVEPTGISRNEDDLSGPCMVRSCGNRFAGEEVWRGSIGSAVAGFANEALRLDGAQVSLGHEASDCRSLFPLNR